MALCQPTPRILVTAGFGRTISLVAMADFALVGFACPRTALRMAPCRPGSSSITFVGFTLVSVDRTLRQFHIG